MKKTVLAALVLQGVLASTAFGAVRSSGEGTCSVYNGGATPEFEADQCRILFDTDSNTSTYEAEGFQTTFAGDALDGDSVTQDGSLPYVRSDSEASWCFDAPDSNHSICFTPYEVSEEVTE